MFEFGQSLLVEDNHDDDKPRTRVFPPNKRVCPLILHSTPSTSLSFITFTNKHTYSQEMSRHSSRLRTPVVEDTLVSPKARQNMLKRSASTASLPSPPPTVRRSKRGSKASVYSDDEAAEPRSLAPRAGTPSRETLPRLNLAKIIEEGENTEEEEEETEKGKDAALPPIKRRRLSELVSELNGESKKEIADEEAFWMEKAPAPARAKPSSSRKPRSGASVESEPERKQPPREAKTASNGAYSLLSPPPSRPVRRVRTTARTVATSVKEILNPRAKTQRKLKNPSGVKNKLPVRDTDNNPFLASTIEPPPKRQLPYNQIPTLTYVLCVYCLTDTSPSSTDVLPLFSRGKRQEFQNPDYKVPPDPRTRLPIDHDDYVASEDIKPRRLFGAYAKLDLENWSSDDEAGPVIPLAPFKRSSTPKNADESDHEGTPEGLGSPIASSSKVDPRREIEEEERELKPVRSSPRRPTVHHDRQTRPMPVRISTAVREMGTTLFKKERR